MAFMCFYKKQNKKTNKLVGQVNVCTVYFLIGSHLWVEFLSSFPLKYF